jgi:hypothetical protein
MTVTATPSVPELARLAELEDEALACVDPGLGVPGFLHRLSEEALHLDAIRVLAHLLPARSAVWWGWGCAVQAAGEPVPEGLKPCIEATRAWIAEPSEERRRAAGAAAEAVDDPTPASLAALAAFLSGGSIAPAGLPDVPAPPRVASKLSAGAVCLAAKNEDPLVMQERLALYLKQGIEVARKSGVWPEGGS